jgi:hypothetical protein
MAIKLAFIATLLLLLLNVITWSDEPQYKKLNRQHMCVTVHILVWIWGVAIGLHLLLKAT